MVQPSSSRNYLVHNCLTYFIVIFNLNTVQLPCKVYVILHWPNLKHIILDCFDHAFVCFVICECLWVFSSPSSSSFIISFFYCTWAFLTMNVIYPFLFFEQWCHCSFFVLQCFCLPLVPCYHVPCILYWSLPRYSLNDMILASQHILWHCLLPLLVLSTCGLCYLLSLINYW